MAHAILALFGALLLLPSANYHVFDGLPLSSLPEFIGLVLLLPLCLSRALRRLYGRAIGRMWPAGRLGLLGAAGLALSAKLLLLSSGTHEGFLACYRSPLDGPRAGGCERSYENPFHRFAATRLDRHLDFAPADWNLSFFNSSRFNFYPWVKGNVRRDRLPLQVTWRGSIGEAEPWEAEITYVGEATISLGTTPVLRLPAHYGPRRTFPLSVPAGRHEVTITYLFDDGSRVGAEPPSGPHATFRFLRAPAADARRPTPVTPLSPGRAWHGLAAGIDAVVLALAVTCIALYARLLRWEWWLLPVVALGAPVADLYRPAAAWVPPHLGSLLILWLLFGRLVAFPRHRPRYRLAAFFAVAYVSLFTVLRSYPRFTTVVYRSAGDDWLTYESLARSILETWSLEGGETVFRQQPLMRYWRFAEHLLLGDGDAFLVIAALTALTWALLWLCAGVWPRRPPSAWRTALFALAGVLLLGLANSATVLRFIQGPLSEYQTWILLPLLFPMLYGERSGRYWLCGTALLGLSLTARANHAPAVLAMLLIFLARARRVHPRRAILAGLLFTAIALLPLAHNVYYGREWVPLTTGGAQPYNLVLSPAKALAASGDADVRARLWRQIRTVLYLTTSGEPLLQLALRGIQLTWVLAALALLGAGRRLVRGAPWLLLVPLLYLGVHVFYVSLNYYPRHILMGYFAMGAVALYAASGRGEAQAGATAPRTGGR